jgi:hypothetical protein
MTKKLSKLSEYIAVFLAVFFLMLVLSAPVFAQGVQFGPANINISVEGSASEERTMAVINLEEDIIYQVELATAGGITELDISFSKNSFPLSPGEQQDILVTFALDKGGEFEGAIQATFSPVNSQEAEGTAAIAHVVLAAKTYIEVTGIGGEFNTALVAGIGGGFALLVIAGAIVFNLRRR